MKIMQKINLTFATLAVMLGVGLIGLAAPALAADSTSKTAACSALKEVDSSQGCGTGDNRLNDAVKAVVQVLSYVLGIAAIIMIIVSGFKYITSGGDSNRISSAKNTLIYALVGLVVAALAQTLVHFVLAQSDGVTKPVKCRVQGKERLDQNDPGCGT